MSETPLLTPPCPRPLYGCDPGPGPARRPLRLSGTRSTWAGLMASSRQARRAGPMRQHHVVLRDWLIRQGASGVTLTSSRPGSEPAVKDGARRVLGEVDMGAKDNEATTSWWRQLDS